MKVAIVVHQFPQLSETFIINQITALLDAGVDVQIFSYYRPATSQKLHPQFVKFALHQRVTYGVHPPLNRIRKYSRFLFHLVTDLAKYRKPSIFRTLNVMNLGKSALNLNFFFKALLFRKQSKFDLIHCHFGPIGHDVVMLREMGLVEGKVITSFHGYDFQRRSVLKQYKNYSYLFKLGDGFIANSSFTRFQIEKLGCQLSKLTTIPVSMDSTIFNPRESTIFNSTYRILTVARLEEVKGIEYAIKAVAELKHYYKINFYYDIVGTGSLLNELIKLAIGLGVSDNIMFHGAKTQDEVVTLLYKTDVFLLTSITTVEGAAEAQGLVLLEAQAAGIPVIASKTGGVEESIINGLTGLLVPEKDSSKIAAALETLYRLPKKRKSMGSSGIKFIQERFNRKVLNDELIKFYNQILGRR